MLSFTPKTEKQIAEANLWPVGPYGFEINSAEDKISSKGNPMIELKVHVFNGEGRYIVVFDYLMEKLDYKLRHASVACGLLEKYETGCLEANDFVGKTGTCKVGIQKDKTGQYPDKNNITDYVTEDKPATPPLDDEIPF